MIGIIFRRPFWTLRSARFSETVQMIVYCSLERLAPPQRGLSRRLVEFVFKVVVVFVVVLVANIQKL